MLRSWTFAAEDQERFASLSGDRNPQHMDALAARRTQVGVQVVHGLHTALRAIEALAGHAAPRGEVCALKVRFARPVLVGDRVEVFLLEPPGVEARLQVEVDGLSVATLSLAVGSALGSPARYATPSVPAAGEGEGGNPRASRAVSFGALAGSSGVVPLVSAAGDFARMFPAAAAWLGPERLQALAGLSWLVGMECPGLYSMLIGFEVQLLGAPKEGPLRYRVEATDDRFRRVRLAVEGPWLAGSVDAMARVPPTRQPTITELAGHVDRAEFAGQVALIVGGSRGLGEVVAKLVAAGGGLPIITFAAGVADAEAVADEIRAFGARCDVVRYDVRSAAEPQLRGLGAAPVALYYFASGPIFRRKTRRYERALFEEFLTYYVHGFEALCGAMVARGGPRLATFYPSSVAVDERPKELTEYAMAKAAGEILCADLTRFEPRLRVLVRRLPRVLTDQTATLLPASSADAVAVLLPVVRAIQGTGE